MSANINEDDLIREQIRYIAVNGCTKIRCKNCSLKNICDRNPTQSKVLAVSIIKKGMEMKNGNQS